MKKILPLATILLLSLSLARAQHAKDAYYLKVVIIRHGEKPDSGNNLSCKGLNRALALPEVLKKVVGKPDFTYVPRMQTGPNTSSVRMFQTVTPFAVKENLVINSNFEEDDSTNTAKDVKTKKGVVLMVWEHGNIPPLARALVDSQNVKALPQKPWPKHDFDSIWIITFTKNATGGLEFQSFAKASENLHPSSKCK